MSADEAAEVSRKLRKQGLKVVFTNGCFDIAHPGHVHVLRRARALGDKLFVGVNTDSSVRKLKGSGRPVNDLNARLAVLSEFRSVDFLVPFGEETPYELIRLIVPDVLVKGGDYTAETVVGAEFVLAGGGSVEIVEYLEDYSSSGILKSMMESSS